MLRIALNGRFYGAPVTGVQRVAREIAARLARRSELLVLLPRGVAGRGLEDGTTRGILPGRWWEQIELPLRLRRAGADVALHLGQAAPAWGGAPSLVMVYDLTPLTHPEWYRSRFRWWFRAALVRPARRATRVLVLSGWVRDELERVLGIPPERIDVVTQGVAPFDRPAQAQATASVRARWELPGTYLLATGAGDRRKNVPFLLEVLRHWPSDSRPALVVTGSPHAHVHPAQTWPRDSGLPVRLLGRVADEELRALYTGAAAFCFPSLAEGFGRPPLEAMGCGTPVIAAGYATAREVLGDAALVLPLDPGLWARTLARLLANSGERAQLSERGRRRAARYDWERATDQVLAACAHAAHPPPPLRARDSTRAPMVAAPATRVALVHDWLVRMRGGERCLEALLAVFPQADIFTLFHVPGAVSQAIEGRLRGTSFINALPAARRIYPYYLPLFPRAIERFDLRDYDLVISVSHCVAKGVRTGGRPHLCYCLTPMRYVWDMYPAYFADRRSGGAARHAMSILAPRLRRWDVRSTERVNRFVAISNCVRDRIARVYRRPAEVVYPPVAVERFSPAAQREDFYLAVSALVPYKRLDLAVDAFTRLGQRLIIVGEGSEYRRLATRAGKNIEFTGWIPDAQVADLMGRCRAFVYPAEEDFGIAVVEAQAAGAPVIAYGAGGALETVQTGEKATGILFQEQTPGAMMDAVRRVERLDFDSSAARANAARFGVAAFQVGIREQVRRLGVPHEGQFD